MSALIAHLGDPSQRIFPPITPSLYDGNESDGSTPDQQAARNLLSLASKKLSFVQRFLGVGLSPPEELSRLLLMHKLAVEAELAAHWQRADFFWRQVQASLSATWKKPEIWQAVVAAIPPDPDATVVTDPIQLRQRLVNELLIETHCAFYNGYIQSEKEPRWDNRAFVHLGYILALVEFAELNREELAALLDQAVELQVKACEQAKKWDRSIQICATMVEIAPDHAAYQSQLAQAYFASTMGQLKNRTTEKDSLKDVKTLQSGIKNLEGLRRKYPSNLPVCELLGHLYNFLAVKQANAMRVADALVSIETSLIYYPGLPQALQNKVKLTGMMAQVQNNWRQISSRMAYNRRARLTPQGVRIRDEARKGTGPAQNYARSLRAKNLAAEVATTKGRYIWQQIGLPEPKGNWDARAQALIAGMATILNHRPKSRAAVLTEWRSVAAQNAELAEYDPALISAFLEERLFGKALKREGVIYLGGAKVEPPVLTATAGTSSRFSQEPFVFWLFSREDKRIKLQALAAIILVLVAGWFVLTTTQSTDTRNRAYDQVIAAAGNDDLLGVMEGAEAFLANPPLTGTDGRESQVRSLYEKAFVRWFARQQDELDSEAFAHIERYRKLAADAVRPEEVSS